jgi:DNA-binding XRE family transcriptional regulator
MKTISALKRKPKREPYLLKKGILNSRIRHFRQTNGLTLRDVSKASGVDVATVNRMEFGCETMLSTALKIAKFFEVTVEDLFSLR